MRMHTRTHVHMHVTEQKSAWCTLLSTRELWRRNSGRQVKWLRSVRADGALINPSACFAYFKAWLFLSLLLPVHSHLSIAFSLAIDGLDHSLPGPLKLYFVMSESAEGFISRHTTYFLVISFCTIFIYLFEAWLRDSWIALLSDCLVWCEPREEALMASLASELDRFSPSHGRTRKQRMSSTLSIA